MLALVFLVVMKGSPISFSGGSISESIPTVTVGDYRTAVNSILDAYAVSHDAGKTHSALILLRVPKEDQIVHFDLVVAFGKLVTKETKDGEARLAAVKAANSWLHL
jgi:hypothetical protein